MDVFIFEKINALAGDWKILDWIGIFLADYFQYILGAILIVLLFWPKKDVIKNRIMVISVFVSVILSRLVITASIKYFYYSDRPYAVLETAKKLITESKDFQSFPSGHASIFFAIAMAVYFYNKKWGIVAFVCAILISVARIFVGVHWPSDVLGGAVIGVIAAIIIRRLNLLILKNKFQEVQPPKI
ncbi:MAG: phosphatase PAP2 family protein [Patescibacteria group bacterium]